MSSTPEAKVSGWFLQGNRDAPHKFSALYDPDCPICQDLHKEAVPLIQTGQLAIRWVPVNFIKPSGIGRQKAILSFSNPVTALNFNYDNFKFPHTGGIRPIQHGTSKAFDDLIAGEKLFFHFPIGTPIILFQNSEGGARIQVGAPADLKRFIKRVNGV